MKPPAPHLPTRRQGSCILTKRPRKPEITARRVSPASPRSLGAQPPPKAPCLPGSPPWRLQMLTHQHSHLLQPGRTLPGGRGLGVLVAEGQTASVEQPGGFLEEGALKLTGGEREVGCGQGKGSAVGGSMQHPRSGGKASLAGGWRGFHSPPRPAPAPGCFQVNWSQPPSLLNNYREPQPWCLSTGRGRVAGGMLRPAATGLRLWKGGSQATAELQQRWVSRGRGPGVIPGESLGHCPVAMAPGCR